MDKDFNEQLQAFRRLSGGFRATRVLLTANNYAVFEHLTAAMTATELAKQVRTDARATEILLDAITGLGLLKKAGGKYRNTSMAKKFLVRKSPWYQGDMLRHTDSLWKNWSGLDEVVRTGLPNRTGARHHEAFIKAMHNNSVFRASDIIDAVNVRGVKHALDLGGGPGTYSLEMARRGIAVTLFDLPNTIEITRTIVKQDKTGKVELHAGDFYFDDIGKGYDLVFISQVLHSLSKDECLMLLKKSMRSLNAKGRVAVHEFFLETDRSSPALGALFSVNMLVNTAAGRCYSLREMKELFVRAGFRKIKPTMLGETVLMIGEKA